MLLSELFDMDGDYKVLKEIAIRLGAKTNPSLTAFMEDFVSSTQAHPAYSTGRIYKGVAIDLSIFNLRIHIGDIQNPNPKNGAGTVAMKFLCDLADKHQVRMDLTAEAYLGDGGDTLSTKGLVGWYKKFGFHIDPTKEATSDDGVFMIRDPK